MRLLLPFLVVLAATAWSAPGALFHAPDTKKNLTQRELLPLETHVMRSLSQELAILASRPLKRTSASHNRAISQLLALALALDPVNESARRTLEEMQKGSETSKAKLSSRRDSLEKIVSIITWLLETPHENESYRFGQLLLDPVAVLHPNLEICKKSDRKGQGLRWDGVVPALAAYEAPLLVKTADIHEKVSQSPDLKITP